jgi:PAS domain S-box-containing protein
LDTLIQKRAYPFLKGGGEMGERTRNYDWSKSPLGSPDGWPQSLCTTVSNLLRSKFPMFLWWGEDMIQFYNDAYRPSLGNEGKHPAALGQKGKDCWPEIWEIIFPLMTQVETTGEATWREDQLVPIYRNGKIEDVYWTYSYSSVLDDAGNHAGILVTCVETTEKVLNQKKLYESERNLRNTIAQAPVAICIYRGSDFIIEEANAHMFEFWGKPSEQVMYKPLFEALPEAKNQGYEELLAHVLKTGESFSANEMPVTLMREGQVQTVYINFTYEPIHEADGTITGIMAMATDVTKQVLNRKQVEESEQRVRSLVESAPFPIGVYVSREMRIELANQSIIDVWGKGNNVIGRLYSEVLPELENQKIYAQLDNVYTTGIPFHARNQRVDIMVDGSLRTFYFNYSFTPLYDVAGKIYGVMNTAADVTDLNAAKQKVEQSERNFRNMILQAPVAMCILLGPEHIIDIANEMMIDLWGKPEADIMFKPVFEALPDAREQGLEQLLNNVYKTGEPFKANEHPVELLRNGKMETVYQNFVYEPYKDADGSILGVLAISIDVTEQVLARRKIEETVTERTRELAQANEALIKGNQELARSNVNLEEFAYAASHDLKEPIRKIHFFSERIKNTLSERMTEVEKQSFERMELAAKRMNALIDDLLSYSQVSLRPRNLEPVDLNTLLKVVIADLDLEIEQKGAKINVEVLGTIQGHQRQLQQVFQNLIGNALKYSKPGVKPVLNIQSTKVLQKDTELHLSSEERIKFYCLITISDNGIGFEQKDAERIFNVFTRLHGNAEYRGTGVGLSIVRKVIENHNGYITATGEPGKGATFKIYLPISE